ncbi:MAG: molybdopterin molybdenumtransferase MoeA [Hyphomicrobium sp. 32-62-53]|nr:MAG: molybdopterin molybdenumtransferase MoeA [Hyphomicrobium sp. 12-62-95]OYX98700.1 MAG: molybdopterin molybdenumtransferase MoeA [Hyphomicrobium sp. 32-62-53]
MGLLSVDDALARILDGVEVTDSARVPLAQAARRVLAEKVAATLTQPPFDASAMDGYAVRAADLARVPAVLFLVGEARAGQSFGGSVGAGQCARIFTGAPLPAGADTVVIQENTQSDGGAVTVLTAPDAGANIRPRGGDFAQGEVLLAPGRVLDARAILLAAAMGHGTLAVRRRPVVAILATGDELVEPGQTPGPDQIVSSNPYGLAAMVAAAGGEPRLLGIAGDTRAALQEKIAAAGNADVLVTIGGASVGDHDLVGPVLQARGMALDFWKIAMRPGKPMLFGRMGAQRVLGLPGNPVSAMICARVFLVPLIEKMVGCAKSEALQRARLTQPMKANGDRLHYMRAIIERDASGGLTVTPQASQDSSLTSVLAASNALIVAAINAPALPAGAEVEVLPLDF